MAEGEVRTDAEGKAYFHDFSKDKKPEEPKEEVQEEVKNEIKEEVKESLIGKIKKKRGRRLKNVD